MARVTKLLLDESGASSLEYCLLISFIAVVILGSVTNLGTTVERDMIAAASLFM